MVLGCLLVLLCWVRALLVLCFFWLFFLLRALLLGSCGGWSLVFGCGFVGDLACLFFMLFCACWRRAFPLGAVFLFFPSVSFACFRGGGWLCFFGWFGIGLFVNPSFLGFLFSYFGSSLPMSQGAFSF